MHIYPGTAPYLASGPGNSAVATGKTPPPLVGGGRGEGAQGRFGHCLYRITPTPALPHQGGGRKAFEP